MGLRETSQRQYSSNVNRNSKKTFWQNSSYHNRSSPIYLSSPPWSTVGPWLLGARIFEHIQPLVRIAIPHRVLIGDGWAAWKTASALIAVACKLGRRDGAAAVIHLSGVETHCGRCWWSTVREGGVRCFSFVRIASGLLKDSAKGYNLSRIG